MSDATATPLTRETFVPLTPWARMRRRALRHGGVMLGGGLLISCIVVALAAPWLAPHDPYAQDLTRRLIDPVWAAKGSWEHPLGTDQLGRDYLSRMIYGSRVSLIIGLVTMVISGLIGTAIGIAAGYFGGRVDHVVNFVVTTRLSMPVILVALAVVAIAGSSLLIVVLVLGLLLWDRFAVVMRSATRQVRDLEYVIAAQAVGMSVWRIICSEILPNVLGALIVVATLEMAHAILLEAALSFLGLGVQPPTPSWGHMVSEGRRVMFVKSWLITIPGAALFLLVLAINLLGDGLRDVMAPEGRS
ncbi:ABC transporter permease [Bradyrhizobium liaoningense]